MRPEARQLEEHSHRARPRQAALRLLVIAVAAPALALGTAACGSRAGSSPAGSSTAARSSGGAPISGITAPDDVLAVIDGNEITLADLDEQIGPQLGQMDFEYRNNRHRIVDGAMRRVVRERLFNDEATRRGITKDALVTEAVTGKINVSDDEVQAFYLQNQAQLGGRTFEQISPQIRTYLETQARESVLDEYAEKLAAGRDVEYVLQPFRVDIDLADAPAWGAEDAPVTLVEFSDFQCPYCKSFAPTLDKVKAVYPGKVRIVFLQFPLRDIHPNAQKAAEAALCIDDQGKFWEAHDLFFAEQGDLSVEGLRDKAQRLGVDMGAFNTCFDAATHVDRIDAELRLGFDVGVNGTPAIFINGRPLPGGAVPFEMVAELINDELGRAGR